MVQVPPERVVLRGMPVQIGISRRVKGTPIGIPPIEFIWRTDEADRSLLTCSQSGKGLLRLVKTGFVCATIHQWM